MRRLLRMQPPRRAGEYARRGAQALPKTCLRPSLLPYRDWHVSCIVSLGLVATSASDQEAHMVSHQLMSARPAPSLDNLPASVPDPRRVAVLLNRNARRVNDALARRLERLCGGHLYYSRTLDEAAAFCREMVQRGYGTIVCGGGDGTLMQAVEQVNRYVDESNAWRLSRLHRYGEVQRRLVAPRFAFLALGTGNGLRRVVGAGDPIADLCTILEGPPLPSHRVPMIAAGDARFVFGGLGYDSMLLDDYNWLRARTRGRLARAAVQTVAGYFAALFLRTLPRLVRARPNLNVRLVTRAIAYYVDPRRGDAAIALPAGSVLYEGPVNMLGVGTTPYFGYGLRIFPFANLRPDMMHLRLATLGPWRTLAHLGSIWRGTYRNPTAILDFLVSDVQLELDRPFPFQHSGDSQGPVQTLAFKIAASPLDLVDFHGAIGPVRAAPSR